MERLGASLVIRRPRSDAHGVLHQLQPVIAFGREDGLGVKLHRFHRQFAMPNAHDHAVFGFGCDFKAGRQRFAAREQPLAAAFLGAPIYGDGPSPPEPLCRVALFS